MAVAFGGRRKKALFNYKVNDNKRVDCYYLADESREGLVYCIKKELMDIDIHALLKRDHIMASSTRHCYEKAWN